VALIAIVVITVSFVLAPLVALVVRAPWSTSWRELTSPGVLDALRLSLICSLAATGLTVAFGTPLAWVLARFEFPGRSVIRTMVTLSMVLPPVVSGVALLLAFGRRGLVGRYLDRWFGVQLPFSVAGVIIAGTFVALPFLVLTAEAAFRTADRRLEEAAFTLGARRWTVFRRITLPAVAPALVSGAALAWARALGEFGATITFAGNFPGRTQTMPLAVYVTLETDPGGAIVLSLVLVAVSFVVLVGLRERWISAWTGPA